MSSKDYQTLTKLGAGAFGVVYKVRNKKDNQIYVIKEVNISKLQTKLRTFAMNQAKILKDINSQYIVKFYTSFLDKQVLKIVMQYCSGGDLAVFIKGQMGKPIKQQIIWKFAIQMIVGLRDLHSQKILHRDIKTLNVFLNNEKDVRIGDLGVAKQMKSDFANTIVGTPYYLSPQMCQQKPYNDRTDIWAMGCVIYQLCTGKHPFQANNQAALALKIIMGKYKDIPSHYSQDLHWLVRACLSVDHKRRPTANFLLSKPQIQQWAYKTGVKTNKQNQVKQQQKVEVKTQKIQLLMQKKSSDEKVEKKQSVYHKVQQKKFQKINKSKQRDISKQKKVNQHQRKNSIEKKQDNLNVNNINKKQQIDKKKYEQQVPKHVPIPSKPKQQKELKLNQYKKSQQQKQKKKVATTIKIEQKVQKQQIKQASPKNQYNNKNKDGCKYQKISVRGQIDREDRERYKELEKIENNNRIQQSDSENQQQKVKILKRAKFVQCVQQSVDDDLLLSQFGITPQKKQSLNFELKQSKSINWQIEEDNYKTLPTIKTPSNLEQVNQIMVNSLEDDEICEQIDDNVPFKDQQQKELEEQYLVEDLEHTSVQLQKKAEENQKRKNELQKLKKYHEKQLLQKISLKQYEKLKQIVTKGTQEQVQKYLQTWIQNSVGLSKFYKILHYDIEIQRCSGNIKSIHQKLEDIKKQRS